MAYLEAGFHSLAFPPEMGGMGMPSTVSMAAAEYFNAGNTALTMYCGAITGAIHIIAAFGSEEVKKMYLPKMMEGKWGGTMCLTEPGAGSDLGALKTKATRQTGRHVSYFRSENLHFSNGEHDMTANIIHPVLAQY